MGALHNNKKQQGMWAKLKHILNSIHFQVLLLVAGFALALVLSSAAIRSYQQSHHASAGLLADAKALAGFTARSIEGQFQFMDMDEIEAILASVKSRTDVAEVFAVDADKMMFFDGDLATPGMAPLPETETLYRAMQQSGVQVQTNRGYVSVAEPLMNGTEVVGALMISFEKPSLLKLGLPIFMTNFLASLPVLAIGLFLAHLIARRITAPIEQLALASARVTNGDLNVNIPREGPREIRNLSGAVGAMLEQLRNNIEQIYTLAYIDHTTQLPNREYFRRELERSLRHVVRHETIGALLFMDLDGFKHVNDTYGHDVGDRLLSEFSRRVSGSLRAGDLMGKDVVCNLQNEYARNHATDSGTGASHLQMAARLGGDEFTVLLNDMAYATDAAIVSRRILDLVSQPFLIDEHEICVGASIGIAVFPCDGLESQTILKRADIAMYKAKKNGKNKFQFFNKEVQELSESPGVLDESIVEELNRSHYISKQGLARLPAVDDLFDLPDFTTPRLAPAQEDINDASEENLKVS